MEIQVTIIGRLTKDIDLDYTPNGTPVGHFTLAVSRNKLNKSGGRDADFPYFEIWQKPAIYLAENTRKGVRVAVQAVFRTESYMKDGQQCYKNYWHVLNFELLERIKIEEPSNGNPYREAFERANNQASQKSQFQQPPIDGINEFGAPTN